MYSRNEIKQVLNTLAKFISVISMNDNRDDQITLDVDYKKAYVEYKNRLDSAFGLGTDIFLNELVELEKEIEQKPESFQICMAYVISVWIDSHLTYKPGEKDHISLYPICKVQGAQPIEIHSLNDNVIETKIWINPKFPVRRRIEEDPEDEKSEIIVEVSSEEPDEEDSRTVLKSSWNGINGELKRVSYFVWDGSYRIRNVIIADTNVADTNCKEMTIAFSPISSEKNLIDKDNVEIDFQNRRVLAVELSLKHGFSHFSKRLESDWTSAAQKGADIVFMPEMLGTEESYGRYENGKNKRSILWVHDLCSNLLRKNEHVPAMTVLPSYWNNRSNSATIVSGTGRVLGVQDKYEPYQNRKDSRLEALNEYSEKEMTVVHIPNVHRVAVIICSEYLADPRLKWSDILCRSLGVSLIIVPSFSPGEQAFYASLSRYREYDTTVAWGNCCGAIRSENKGIGGCSIAGLNVDDHFGAVCQCEHSCKGIQSCVFTETLSLVMPMAKTKEHKDKHNTMHFVEREKSMIRPINVKE